MLNLSIIKKSYTGSYVYGEGELDSMSVTSPRLPRHYSDDSGNDYFSCGGKLYTSKFCRIFMNSGPGFMLPWMPNLWQALCGHIIIIDVLSILVDIVVNRIRPR